MFLRPARLAALLALLSSGAACADVFVIANTALQVSAEDIRDVFLGERQFAGSQRLIPVDNAPLRDEFLAKALRMDATKYNSMWIKRSFREGLNAPAIKSGDAEVADFVRRTPGAIGYVSKAPNGVAVLRQF